jgi:hypothetical protein
MKKDTICKRTAVAILVLAFVLIGSLAHASAVAEVTAQVDTEFVSGYIDVETYQDLILTLQNISASMGTPEHDSNVEAFMLIVSVNAGAAIAPEAANRINHLAAGL